MLLVHRIVDEVLVEATIFNAGGQRHRARSVLGKAEPITYQLRPARLNCVVICKHAVVPDLVQVVELALGVDEAAGEGVGRGVKIAVGLNEAAFGQDLARSVLDGEVHPGLIEVPLLGDERVADALVLNDDIGDKCLTGSERKAGETERSNQPAII